MLASRDTALAGDMLRWYYTQGTPLLTVSTQYSPARRSLTITLHQEQPWTEEPQEPLPIPVAVR